MPPTAIGRVVRNLSLLKIRRAVIQQCKSLRDKGALLCGFNDGHQGGSETTLLKQGDWRGGIKSGYPDAELPSLCIHLYHSADTLDIESNTQQTNIGSGQPRERLQAAGHKNNNRSSLLLRTFS